MRYSRFFLALVLALANSPVRSQSDDSIHKIRHVVIIMQENRSFDSYFGTFPGADGIPMSDGVPTVCVPDPGRHVRPAFPRSDDLNRGGPHNVKARDHRRRRRQDGRLRREPRNAGGAGLPRSQRAQLRRHRRGHGIPRRARDSELLEVRARFRAPRPPLRAECVVEFAAASLHGLRMVGVVQADRRSDELRQRAGDARYSARLPILATRASAARPGGPTTPGPISPISCTRTT